jgi:hypothetical protein
MFHRRSLRQAGPKNLSEGVQNIGSAAAKNWAGAPKNCVRLRRVSGLQKVEQDRGLQPLFEPSAAFTD